MMRWPYLTFIIMVIITFGYIIGLNKYEDDLYQQQYRHVDPTTGTWKKDYDWQAENLRIAFLDRLRYLFIGALSVHSVVNCFYALSCTLKNVRHIFTLILFIITAVLLALLWLAMGVPAGGMIG
jgi:hypothetical protein